MADDKTIIQNEVNFTSKGIEDVTKKVEILETNLGKVAKQAEAIVTQFEKLGKTHINVNSINPNQSQYKLGRNNFVLRDSKEDKETKTILNKQLEKANEAELQATIAHTNALNADTEKIKKQTEQADAVLEVRQRNSETNKKNSENRSRYLDKNMNWYKYRDEHPEMFVSRSSQPKYQWGATLSEVGHTVSGLGGAGARIGGDLTSVFGMALKNGPLALATQGISKLVSGLADLSKASLQAYSEIETLKTGLSIISPTQVQADTLFRDVADYATRSPYGVAQSTELVTLLKQSGVNDSELMSTLTMLGDTAGGNMEKLKRIANNYAQIVSIGKASMLDMRQFAYAGIPIFEAVSKELGVTQQALREMISDGKVTSDVIEKVFKDLTSSNGIFANATEIGAKTFSARKQNLADTKQLALAEMGEAFINIWSGTGANLQNEGIGREFLNFSENIYQGLQRWANGENIEKSITNIEKREARLRELKELIDYNKQLGNDAVVRKLEKQYNEVSDLKDIEKDRASYKELYDIFYQGFESLKKEFPKMPDITTMSLSDIFQKRDIFRTSYDTLKASRRDYSAALETGSELIDVNSVLAVDEKIQELFNKKTSVEEAIAIIEEEYNFWVEALQVRKEFKKLRAESFQADIETRALQEQQRVSDLIDESSKNPNSIANIASQITQEYQKTEEYQQKQLEQQKKQWEEAKQILNNISKYQKENGIVDFTKLGLKDAVQYFNKGSFSVERDLNIVEGKNAAQLNEDKGILTTQFGSAINQIQTYIQKSGLYDSSFARLLSYVEDDITKDKTTTQWYKDFSSHFIGLSDSINNWIEKESDENKKEQLGGIKDFLSMATLLLSSNTDAKDYNIDELLKKSGTNKDFIPLWKRLLSNATGLSANVISGTNSALANYRDDLAIRNTTSGVLRAGLQGGLGVDFVQQLLKTSGVALELRGDKGGTYQIDWKETGKAVKEFAMQLSASTKVISAYKSGLEAQLNVYETLLSDALVSSETQDIKGDKKFTTAKELSQLAKDYGDQLVNAFGEKLTTKDGLEVSVKDGEFFDQNGNKIAQENVIVTGNIYEFIKQELPKIRQKLADVNIQENKNAMLENLVTGTKDAAIFKSLMLQGGVSKELMAFMLSNKGFVTKDVDEQLNKIKIEQGIEKSNTEIYKESIDGTDVSSIILLLEAVDQTSGAMKDFINSDGVQELLKQSAASSYNEMLLNAAASLLPDSTNTYGYTDDEVALDATKQAGMGGYAQRYFYGPMIERATGIEGSSKLSISDIAQATSEDEAWVKKQIAAEAFKKTIEETSLAMQELSTTTLKDGFIAPFEKLGEIMTDSSASMSDLRDVYKKLGADLLSNIGPLITNVGLSMAQAAALEGNWGKVAAGLALAAAGGVIGGFGSGINNNESKDSNDNEYERLESLKDDLSKILEQARRDAAYYENNMRHKNALGVNEKFSYRSVNDAIITPQGHVISTHPDDYLIATKQPQNLVGQKTVQPIINNIVNNNAGVQVKQEQKNNGDGSVDIITTIENVVGNYISSSKSDDAFSARNFRLRGKQAIM